MRQKTRNLFAFLMGASCSLVLESFFLEKTSPAMTLWFVLSASCVLFAALSWSDVKQAWFLWRQRPAIWGPLEVEQILDLHHLLARDDGGGRMSVRMDPSDKNSPIPEVGMRITDEGKLTKRMNSGTNEVVGCKIRMLAKRR